MNLVLPFLTLPYLGRVLGAENYGVVLMVIAIMQYLFVICDYGFNLSATKDIAIYREDKGKVNEIFSNIFYIKFVLVFLSFVILTMCIFSLTALKEHKTAYFLGFGIVIGQVLNPVWLFQGMEKMKYMTWVNIIAKGTFTALIFVFIRVEEDYLKVPLLYSLGFLIGGLFSMYFAFKFFKIKWIKPNLDVIKNLVKHSTQYFLSRSAATLYTTSNTIVAGLALGNYYAGIFGAAEKLFMAMTVIYNPLGDALYPYMAKNKNIKLYKRVFIMVMLLNTVVATLMFIYSAQIVLLIFGEEFRESIKIFELFCLLVLIFVPTVMLGYPFLGALGKEKYANYSVVFASLVHLVLLAALFNSLTIYRILYLLIFTQSIVFVVRLIGSKILWKELKTNMI